MDELNRTDSGLIFEIQPGQISAISLGWAQGPNQIAIGGRRRIYFSTRVKDSENYVYSEVRFVDFSLDLSEQLSSVSEPVLGRSGPGCFDEHGIFPLHPIQLSNHDNVNFKALSCGWQRKKSVDIEMKIGELATQDGGKTFKRVFDGPLMGPNSVEPFLIGDPFVLENGEKSLIYYIYGSSWQRNQSGIPEREYKIGVASYDHAKSEVSERVGVPIISDAIENEAQAMPTVVNFKGLFHMFFCYRSVFEFREKQSSAYKLAHAYSHDGLSWKRSTASFLNPKSEWDSRMQCYPNAFVYNDDIHILYNGNNFGFLGFGCTKIKGDDLNEYSRLQS